MINSLGKKIFLDFFCCTLNNGRRCSLMSSCELSRYLKERFSDIIPRGACSASSEVGVRAALMGTVQAFQNKDVEHV